MKNKATNFLITDLLENIIALASKPTDCAEYITNQVRELVGVKIVALMQAPILPDDNNYSVVSVCPRRHISTVACKEINNLCRLSEGITSLINVSPYNNQTKIRQSLSALDLGDSIIIPLKAGNKHVGALLLLDLLSPDGLSSITEALKSISGVIGLIFNNSILFRNLDDLVEKRTSELNDEILVRKQAEEMLRRYQHIVASSTDMLALLDTHFTYLAANQSYLAPFNLSFEELIGSSASTVFGEDFYNTFIKTHAERCLAGEEVNFQTWFDFPDNRRCLEVTYYPYYNEVGSIVGFVVNKRNITDRVQAENEKAILEQHLQQAHKMEAIGTLAGGIAHDFNNILGPILGYAELAKEDSPSGTLIAEDLDKILLAANRAKDLVKQILTFSRKSHLEPSPLLLQPLVKEGLKMLRSSIPSTIRITADIDPQCGVVLADPTHFHQILMNLCTNAYHAMEKEGGTLSIILKTTFISSNDKDMPTHVKPGEYVECAITDTGVGIETDIINKIFDPFFTTKDQEKGTGMGLAIIHRIMSDYKGAITVESKRGQGSTFHVYFPVVKIDVLPQISKSEDILTGKEEVLFVDDEELLGQMVKVMLDRLGYRVTALSSSIAAITTFENDPYQFDIIITDQTMPDMTGSDMARRMMQTRPDIPIILCTGHSNIIDEHSAKAIGIKEFVLKPISQRELAKLIRKVLDSR